MTRARTKKKPKGFRCSNCGAQETVWAGRCSKCQSWDTLKDTSVVAVAETKRKPEVEALIERVAAMNGVTRKNAAMTVDMLISPGGLDVAALGLLVDDVAERHRVKRMDSPCGYLVTTARKKLGLPAQTDVVPSKDTGKALEAQWGELKTSAGMKPAAMLIKPIAEQAKPKKDVKASADSEDEKECPSCDGAKFVRREYVRGVTDRPAMKPCPDCTGESAPDRRARLIAASGLQGPMLGMTMRTFRVIDGLEDAIAAAKRFACGEIAQLVLISRPGRGKTHLGTAVLNACIDKGEPAIYLNVAGFLDDLRMTYETTDAFSDLWRPATQTAVALLDDVGAQRRTEWAIEKLYELVEARYRVGLRTIACSNEQPDTWDIRVKSRLCDGARGEVVIIPEAVPDHRLKRK